jgi:transcriptional regulator with XRE-family HTH domain
MSHTARATVGEIIRGARVKADVTQPELARRLRIDASALARMESGEQGCTFVELFNIARALRIGVHQFFRNVLELLRSRPDAVPLENIIAAALGEPLRRERRKRTSSPNRRV